MISREIILILFGVIKHASLFFGCFVSSMLNKKIDILALLRFRIFFSKGVNGDFDHYLRL